MSLNINPNNLPEHIAVIMDGNGRWAKSKGAARLFGHKHAVKAVRDVTEGCAELGVKFLTLYAFSTENWGRPKAEVDGLMSLLVSTIKDELGTLQKNDVKLMSIGDIAQLPAKARQGLIDAKKATENNQGLKLVLALNYSSRWDIGQACNQMVKDSISGKIVDGNITYEDFSNYLSTKDIPDPELLIRTSGEMRISNFLLCELAYTELYFTELLWPDFRKEHLIEAIISYQQRERRFGKISEQVN